ncbi:hypothetical protein IQ241_16910 [Romeria aff. gracilis LEGE 07310]|uniref:Fatty acid desaturase n=1 Tax=Vasconcelosia minhoensis LEGE 07310 TaxID=915328 RepID=A0A8J7AQX3_9CYAN|nr:hypothetical protein [Romeria aff. gracilis LEGE 07310]
MQGSLSLFPEEYRVTEQDGRKYTRYCLLSAGILVGVYGLAILPILPLAALPIAVLLLLPRWMINFHELLHIYDQQQINPVIRLMGVSPLPLSVISLSYSQVRTLHFAHHAAPATDADPDAYHIRGSWPQSIFNAFVSPEQSAIRWIAKHGLTLQLSLDLATKLIILGGLTWVGGRAFLWLWLSLRLVYGLGDIAFFRMIHHREGEYGTFALPLPSWLLASGELIFGQTVIQATIHHDIHHQNPRIAARALAAARDDAIAAGTA